MKKGLVTFLMVALLGAAVCGCGTKEPEMYDSIQGEPMESSQTKEIALETEKPAGTEAPVETQDLTFGDLAVRRFEFTAGSGGWWEEFTIEKDGYFTGKYGATDMESNMMYSSSYSGHFSELTKVDEFVYEMKLKDITYKEEPGTEKTIEGMLYNYVDTYCLGGNDTFKVYLPGTPLSMLSEEVKRWIGAYNQDDTLLTIPIIVDEENGYGIYSFERPSASEDAKSTLAAYEESFAYYNQLLSDASTTMEMVELSGRLYELSDECLNYLWNLIRYNTQEERYQEILTEQREWIKEKEATAEAARDSWEGGSFAPVDYNDTLATKTIERCRVLADYLQK